MSLARERHAFRLDAAAGWRRGPRDDRVAAGARLRLRAVPGSGRPLADASGSFGGLADATGMVVSPDGTVYVLDGHTPGLYRFDPCERRWEWVPCIAGHGSGPREVRDPHGLALTRHGDLLIADTGNHRVQVVAASGFVLRASWGPLRLDPAGDPGARLVPTAPGETPGPGWWEPYDVAVMPDGRAVVSDAAGGLLAFFDWRGRLLGTADGAGEGFAPLSRPTHVAVDRDGRIYVVQEGIDAVTVLDAGGRPLERLARADEAPGRFRPGPVTVGADGAVLVADTASGTLLVFGPPEDAPRWRPQVSCQPCGLDAIATGPGGVVVAGGASPRVEELDPGARLEALGTFTTGALDSRMPGCRWHRVVLQTDVPPGTLFTVQTLTAEAAKTDAELAALPASRWSDAVVHDGGSGQWDCLVASPPGRFLWLRLGLEGTGTLTPEVASASITYPRETSAAYLPGIYQHQPGGDDFADRLLALFDRPFADLSTEVAELARYFDPYATPAGQDGAADFLSWLASWIGLGLDRHWPVERRRRLVAEASWLYARRGTVEGLRRHLEIYLGYAPRILEHHRLRHWFFAGDARLGDCSRLWGSAIRNRLQLDVHARLGEAQLIDTHDPLRDPFWTYAHQFTVFVPAGGDETRRHALERIIELAKPAHTKAVLRVVEPRLRIGEALVGMDTVVAAYPSRTVAGEARLGADSVLAADAHREHPPSLEIGARRIGADTVID